MSQTERRPRDDPRRRPAGRRVPADGEQRPDPPRPACAPTPSSGCGRRSTSSATSRRPPRSRCARSGPAPSASRSTRSGPARTTRRWRRSSASLGMRAGAHGAHIVPFGSPGDSPMLAGLPRRCGRAGSSTPSSSPTPTTATRARPGWRRTASRSRPSAGSGTTRPSRAGSTSTVPPAPAPRSRTAPSSATAPSPSSAGRRARSSATTGARGWAPAARAESARPRGRQEALRAGPRLHAAGAARRLLRDLGPGDAVVCASDVLALGVHHELLAAGRAPAPTSASSASTAPRPP